MPKNISSVLAHTKGLQVLYIEDDVTTQNEILETLQYFFNVIQVAYDGEEGLEVFQNNTNSFDLIITDIIMPKMNGLDMVEKIREIDPDIAVIVFSAYGDSENLTRAIELNVDGFLTKPITNDNYLKVLSKVSKNISNKKELKEYKSRLEGKVNQQLLQLQVKDEMIEKHAKLAAMGEMIDVIAHQWKQPLNLIAMRSSFLEEMSKMDGKVSLDDVLECSSNVAQQITHLVETLQEFRSFFRPIDECENISLEDLFKSLEVLLQDDLVKNCITLEKDLVNVSFYGNKNELKHLFINLINNARDAFIQNNIENRKISISSKQNGDILEIICVDNAGGIPEQYIQDIFEAHFTTKKSIGGTGIGLYICKTIVNKHHGHIDVKSDQKNGFTEFSISIPMNELV